MKLKAIGYTRLSQKEIGTEEIMETTFERQAKLISRYAQSKGYILTHILQDNYTSGGKLESPTFKKLIQKANGVDNQVVIVKDLSRFARNLKRQEDAYNLFTRKGVKLEVVMGIDPKEKFQRRLMGLVNEQYLDKMRDDTKNLHLSKLKSGLPITRPPYGYRRSAKTKQWVVNVSEAKKIHYIFQEYVKGARTMLDMGCEVGLSTSQVSCILQRKEYTGVLVVTKRYRDSDNLIYKEEKQEEKEKHKPIITQEQFEKATNIRKKRKLNARYKEYIV